MKLTLNEYTPSNIRRARNLLRRTTSLRLFVRNGRCFTVTYNPGRQPDSLAQLHNRSLFKKANDMVAADFANPVRRNYWFRKLRSQSRYKTARGLARAFYMAILKARMSKADCPDVALSVTPESFVWHRVSAHYCPLVRNRKSLLHNRSLFFQNQFL